MSAGPHQQFIRNVFASFDWNGTAATLGMLEESSNWISWRWKLLLILSTSDAFSFVYVVDINIGTLGVGVRDYRRLKRIIPR